MIRSSLIGLAALAVAVPALAQDITPERRDAFIAMIAAEGCSVHENDADRVMDGAGFTYQEANAILDVLIAEGVATFDGTLLTLSDAICSAGGGAQAEFLALLRDNGCSATEDEAEAMLAGSGLTMRDTIPVVNDLLEEGMATYEGGVLTLVDSMCETPVEIGGGSGGSGADKAEVLAGLISGNGCTLTDAESETILDGTDITDDEAAEIVIGWIGAGLASFDGEMLVLGDTLCASGSGTATSGGGDAEETLLAAVRDNGCAMTGDEAEATLPGLGLDMETAENIAMGWVESGQAEFRGDSLVLFPQLCSGADATGVGSDGSEEARLAQVIRDNGCSMSEAEAEAMLPGMGFTQDAVGEIAERWIEEGLATLENDRLTLGSQLCGGEGGSGGSGGGTTHADGGEAVFLQALRDNGCRMTEREFNAVAPGLGLDEDILEPIVERWGEEGLVSFDRIDGVETLVLGEMLCQGSGATTGGGSTAAAGSPEEILLGAIREIGCSMGEAEAEAMLPPRGLEVEDAEDIAMEWIRQGKAEFTNDRLVIFDELCAGHGDSGVDTTGSPADTLLAAVRDNGCIMSEADAEAVMPYLGLTMEEAEDIAMGWVESGEADFVDGRLVLSEALCKGTGGGGSTGSAGGSDEDRLAAAFREAGCSLTRAEGEVILRRLGISEDAADPIVEAWMDDGRAIYDRDTRTLSLSDTFCAAGGDSAAAGGDDPADKLVAVIEAAGCSMDAATGETAIPAAGIPAEVVPDLVDALIADGRAAYDAPTETLTLTTEGCR